MKKGFQKAVLSLLVASLFTFSVRSAHAFDIVMSPMALVLTLESIQSDSKPKVYFFAMTRMGLEDLTGLKKIDGLLFVGLVIGLPLLLLNENSQKVTVDAESLRQLGYTDVEIQEYAEETEQVLQTLKGRTFSSEQEALQAVHGLKLGVVAKDLMRIN
ncbi:hypothetical protein [Bdellovibrio sp.]|uniref:hypothetical protein n=1 Tax=Bdellovibrio sp. TaxID=28201 RepID=UPI0039E4EEBC